LTQLEGKDCLSWLTVSKASVGYTDCKPAVRQSIMVKEHGAAMLLHLITDRKQRQTERDQGKYPLQRHTTMTFPTSRLHLTSQPVIP
jgi:hypothetical protein